MTTPGAVVMPRAVWQLELGQQGGQVVQGLPVLPWGADLFEVVPGPLPQGVPGERRRVRIPIGGLSFGDPGQGVVPVDLMQVIADTPTWA